LNQHAYKRKKNGKLVPYKGKMNGKVHLVGIDQFAELLGRGWQSALVGAAGGMGGMGGMPI